MKQVIAMQKQNGDVEIEGTLHRLSLPKGCTGILLCFESKKAAREECGKDVELLEITNSKPKK